MFNRYDGVAWEDRFLPRLTRKQIKELPKEEALVILSVGAVEQHGDHLPVMTDSLIGEATLTRALEKVSAEHQIWVIPPISYGKSNEHLGIAGTISLSANTLHNVIMDIAESLKASGFRRLLLMNTHGGNMDLLNVVSREIRINTGIMVFYLAPSSLKRSAKDLFSADELEYGIHAGDYETSVVMAIKPNWVQHKFAANEIPNMKKYDYLTMEGKIRFAWVMNDISASGIAGDATLATVEKGELVMEQITDTLAKALVELSKFEITEVKKS
jgi:creatinine amidohydrolase